MAPGEDWRAVNLASWEERARIHLGPRGYDRSSHRAGRGALDAVAEAELGEVRGLRVLHLQCHTGDDTVAIAQRGAAEAVGLDFSPAAVEGARALAAEVGVAGRTRFVVSDLYAAAEALPGEDASFDLVFVTWGALGWLPDMAGWARVVARFLRPGGALYLAEAHPFALVFDNSGEGAGAGRPGWFVPYFHRGAIAFDDPQDYADPEARVAASRTVVFQHALSDILGALWGAGLRPEWFREHARIPWRMFEGLARDAEGLWAWPERPWLPLGFSLRAVRERPAPADGPAAG